MTSKSFSSLDPKPPDVTHAEILEQAEAGYWCAALDLIADELCALKEPIEPARGLKIAVVLRNASTRLAAGAQALRDQVALRSMRDALRSIAANSCCSPCREAGMVAQKALVDAGEKGLGEMGQCQHGVRIAQTCPQCVGIERCEHGVAKDVQCPACALQRDQVALREQIRQCEEKKNEDLGS